MTNVKNQGNIAESSSINIRINKMNFTHQKVAKKETACLLDHAQLIVFHHKHIQEIDLYPIIDKGR